MGPVDVVVVGSGFGGAVMAARLGRALRTQMGNDATLLVIEKGDDHSGQFDSQAGHTPLNAQGNRYRQSYDPEYLSHLAQVYTDRDGALRDGAPSLNILAGLGIGGGSNVYAGISLRAPSFAFELAQDGRRLWPRYYSRPSLDPYYDQVEQMLRVHRLHWTDEQVPHWQLATKRDYVFAEGCRRIGATAVPLKLADDNDANEGFWTQGQRFSGRQNLALNYLAEAKAAGVIFAAGSEVTAIEPNSGGYLVRGVDNRTEASRPFEIECKLVIVACGSIGSSALLLRNQQHFGGDRQLDRGQMHDVNPSLGKNVSGNGDYGVCGIVGAELGLEVESFKGKPISSVCASYWKAHQILVLPFHADPVYLALGQISTLLRPELPEAVGRRSTGIARDSAGRPERDWGLAYKERLRLFGSRILSMGCLAIDDREGEVVLGAGGDIQVRWPETRPSTEARWSMAATVMRRIYEALGGEMYLDSYRKDGTVNTSHPLGGCAMAERADERYGVVDPFGEAFGNRNLFVVDGAIIPTALGANPTLTIAAVAESIADRLIRGDGTESLFSRLAA